MNMNDSSTGTPLDLGKWRNVPKLLMGVGGALSLIGLFVNREQFAYSWLLSFMFFLSLCLGSLFLILMHHLFDASWTVPIRRFCEHIAALAFPWMAVLFLPIAILAPDIYTWMHVNPQFDHALRVKQPLFTWWMFDIVAIFCFLVWGVLAHRLRYWSLQQDKTGEARATHRMRRYSGPGIYLYALSLTIAAIMWVKALDYQWYSTIYGVYYFAGSVWLAIATAYIITMVLDRQGILTPVMHEHQYYYLGSLLFAFTVFYAYIAFAQYFIIWNGNMPDETFWYVLRERGTWWWISMVIIFGHFFVPFLGLLRIDVKNVFAYMTPLCIWAWAMHWVDLCFNIMPVLHPAGFAPSWQDVTCFAFMGGLLSWRFLAEFAKYPPYPIKDPRLSEAMGLYHPIPAQMSGAELDQTDEFPDAPPQFGGTNQ